MNPGRHFIPSLFSVLNLFLGFLSLLRSSQGNLHAAAWFIILAVLCDGMDGKLARWTHLESDFGLQLDSMADLISFGVAPAFLMYQGGFHNFKWMGMIVGFIYLFSGWFRLARFNVYQAGDRRLGYIGLPIPVSGMTLASLWLFFMWLKILPIESLVITLSVFLSLLMISTVHYNWPRLDFQNNLWRKIYSILLLVALIFMSIFPQISMFPILLIYIFSGILHHVVDFLRKEDSKRRLFHLGKIS